MHIVFGNEVADELRKKYTVLELDTITHPEHGKVPAFCVLPVEKIALEMSSLEQNVKLHEQIVQGIKDNDTALVLGLCQIMAGKFGGDLDTFYEEIVKRINTTGSTALVIS